MKENFLSLSLCRIVGALMGLKMYAQTIETVSSFAVNGIDCKIIKVTRDANKCGLLMPVEFIVYIGNDRCFDEFETFEKACAASNKLIARI
jgi:hypothetical protein